MTSPPKKLNLNHLMKMNLLPAEFYKIDSTMHRPKLSFGIDRILNTKCSSTRRREDEENKYKNIPQSYYNIRKRTSFSEKQLNGLEKAFENSKYISGCSRLDLAAELGLEVKQVKIWFQNRRFRSRREESMRSSSENTTDSDN